MTKWALLVLRLTCGGLIAGHGAQKAFGWFEGYGLKGTKGWLQSMGYPAEQPWGEAAALSELGGGVLTALGFLGPVGPVLMSASMATATAKAHWGKPIWVTAGGAELPVTNMAIAAALMLAGPGELSLDDLLGAQMPRWIAVPLLVAAAGGVTYGVIQSQQNLAQQQQRATPHPPLEEATRPSQQEAERPQASGIGA
jgi:putative oxidoreductase